MPFSKGQSGNPGGRKNEKPWRDALMLAVNEAEGDAKKLRKLAEKLVDRALAGDVPALKEIGDRLDGKPAQAITDGDGGPLMGPVVKVYIPDNGRGDRTEAPEGPAGDVPNDNG